MFAPWSKSPRTRPTVRFLPIAFAAAGLAACHSADGPAPAEPPASSAETEEATIEHAAQLFAKDPALGVAEARRVVARMQDTMPQDDHDRAAAELELASMLLQTGERQEARAIATAVSERAEVARSEAESLVATTLKFLGALDLLGRDFASAREKYERAVALSQSAVGPDDPETAKHLGNLATVMLAQGETESAEGVLERAIAIWDTAGSQHPVYTVQSLSLLAGVRTQQGRVEEALALYERGVAIQESAWGVDSPRLAKLLREYAGALRAAGRDAQAETVERRLGERS